jgi:hypothetical protein
MLACGLEKEDAFAGYAGYAGEDDVGFDADVGVYELAMTWCCGCVGLSSEGSWIGHFGDGCLGGLGGEAFCDEC